MNWNDLKLFLELYRRPRLDEVSAYTSLDSTTISRRIKKLEKQLGVTLFERTRRGHLVTPAGEQIADLAERMDSAAAEILQLTNANQTLSGRVRLGAPEGVGTTIVAPALAKFRQEHPLIDVDLFALSGFISVPKRQADMSILLNRPTSGRMRVRKLSDYDLYLYASEKYLADYPPINEPDDLAQHTLIGYSDELIYSSQLRYLQDVLPGREPQLCSPSIIAQKAMVATGAGVGILPAFMVRNEPNFIKVIPSIKVERAFWLAVHEDVAALSRVREVVDFLVSLSY